MSKIVIVCVEDERDVLDAVIRELEPLEDLFLVEAAENAQEARELLIQIREREDETAVIFCDHIMPGENGVDLLVDLQKDERWKLTRKVLLTGQAGLEATVKAVNQAELAHYIAKPWEGDEILQVAKREIAFYLIARDLNPLPYLRHLDVELIDDLMRKHLSGDR
ncbi:response regulator [Kiritimatiellaeota bacterium B1221]|nr:response regulator [Kiritimatiellaeota bacterium B1221]